MQPGQRRPCPTPVLFLAALAIGAGLYAHRTLSAWVEQSESDLVVLCLTGGSSGSDAARLLAEVEKEGHVRRGRVIGSADIASWVTEAIRDAGATPTLAESTTPPAAVELTFRGPVRYPERFGAILDGLAKHPACKRLFVDRDEQQRNATFHARARRVLVAYLAVTIVGVVAAVAGAVRLGAGSLGAGPPAVPAIGDTRSRARGVVRAVLLHSIAPAATGWFCLFVIVWVWPIPLRDGLRLSNHPIVLAETIVVVALARWCGERIGRYLA